MAALLQAAATGRLWSDRGGNTSMALELQDIEDDRNEQSSSTARKLVRLVLMRSFKRSYYMALSHKDWELPNLRIWLAEIVIESSLDLYLDLYLDR